MYNPWDARCDDPICPYCGAEESSVCESWCETQRPATEAAPTDDNLTTTPSNDPSS